MEPLIEGKLTVEWDRGWNPGKLTMNVVITEELDIGHGNSVRFTVDGDNENPFFYGYIFKFKEKKEGILTCTCFDQMRYLKNKDSYTYQDMTYSELLKMIAKDRNLDLGEVEDTEYKIPGRIEENKEYYEILKVASDLTTTYTDNLFELFDKGGKLCLKNIQNMKVDSMVLDEDVFQDYDYESSINESTYNRVKIDKVNHDTNSVEPQILEDKGNIAKWGVLQYYAITTEEDIDKKMKGILALSNKETRRFNSKGAIGNVEVRAGSLIPVFYKFYDLDINGYMLVDSVKHEFEGNYHFMDMELFNKDIKPTANLENMFKNEQKQQEAGGEYNGELVGGSVQEQIWFFLKSQGFSDAAAAAIMGNWFAESSMNPGAIESNGEGHGLAQWSYSRKQDLFNFAKSKGKDWKDLQTQLEFFMHEINGPELWRFGGQAGLNKFKNMTDPAAAAKYFSDKYERPGTPRMHVRTGKAQEYYNQLKGKQPSVSTSGGGTAKGNALLSAAQKYNGVKYVYGTMGTKSTDCSGMITSAMKDIGLTPAGGRLTSRSIHTDPNFVRISKEQLRPGDILSMNGHVAIYAGNGKTFEATPPRTGTYNMSRNTYTKFYRLKGA